MNPTFTDAADTAQSNRVRSDLGNGARTVKDVASGELKNLATDVKDLASRTMDVDAAQMRNKVQDTLASARIAIASGAQTVKRQAQQVAGTTDDFVRGSPWQAVGIAALFGAVVGFLVHRRT